MTLNSLIEIAPTAHQIARELDAERANGTVRSAIHGLPIVVKDGTYHCPVLLIACIWISMLIMLSCAAYNTHPELGMNTTAGSYALLQGSHAKSDAFVVKKLRDASAIILGKANQDEVSISRTILRMH